MSFNDFSFNPHVFQAIQLCGFTAPTPIQQQAIGPILERRDLLGLAQTGTGKTAAFILPTVQHLMAASGRQVRALVIAPTRELAEQIHAFTRTIIDGTGLRAITVYGGVSKQAQINKIRGGVDIVVACPGRLLDILNDKAIDLSQVDTLILDEADHMFDKGFLPDIRRIVRRLPRERQNLVFSATMPAEIRHLAEEILTDPVTVQINLTRSVQSISHQLYSVKQGQKTALLINVLQAEQVATTLVFTRTKFKAKNLARQLAQHGFKVTSLQGNLSQSKRQQALDGFKDGTFNILVATDIAARGIDVAGISHVINYDMPDTTEAYIHRTGRTGRASCSGEAMTFATNEDGRMVQSIERFLGGRMYRQPVDTLALANLGGQRAARKGAMAQRKQVSRDEKVPGASSRQPKPVEHQPLRSKGPRTPGVFGLSGRTR
ncbi:DEAD/DEAH box helicase [Desulfobulbus alkaliphilus]|uniref:DEAD/DEAH box helicase n=1 Tax=Desulfobulbus alkaliphilus TaxID=869814 RepID=UPI001964201F|nr:DEAD/DEAH box helicase [Desulfobulbus alkaliphilus]MBM9537617.1 DEAD/DEAH box helicase [Desulfobulbus alkaliphilus]